MKKLSPTLIASVAVVAALIGAGGALITRDNAEPARSTDLTIRTAEESSAPEPTNATPEETPVTTPELETAPEPNTPTGTTPKAPDRDLDPAQPRREVPAAEPVDEPVVETTPAPKPECLEGATRLVPWMANSTAERGVAGEDTCINGEWVRTKEPQNAPKPAAPTPAGPTNPAEPEGPSNP